MRLHFWAAREEGLLEHPAFADYYTRFIAHFVSVYERTAPSFARESMRWSADKANVQRYLDAGRARRAGSNTRTDCAHAPSAAQTSAICYAFLRAAGQMPEIMDLSLRAALATLPAEERAYTGSAAAAHWPYEQQ
jgi:hypothetical protein